MRNEQEEFWSGEFGDAYSTRNSGDQLVASKIVTFSQVLARTHGVTSVLELGANIGLNMRALRALLPAARLEAVEINDTAWRALSAIPNVVAHHGSLLDFKISEPVDFAFTMGVLIHVNPDALDQAYARLYDSSCRYVAMIEYYNPSPVEVVYRGNTGKLFKRDWCKEFLNRYPTVRLVDYGFRSHHDPVFPEDDFTWFLLEKV